MQQNTLTSSGLTLVELLITLGIIIVTLLCGSYNYHNTIAKTKCHTTMLKLMHILKFAQTYAITQQQQVGICASYTDTTCDPYWHNRLIVFNENRIIKTFYLPPTGSINLHSFMQNNKITITPQGYTHQNGHLSFSYQKNFFSYQNQLYFNQYLQAYLYSQYA